MRQKWNFFAERNFFLAAKTEISCRKAVFRRAESGEKRGFAGLFLSGWGVSAGKNGLTFCGRFRLRADAPVTFGRKAGPWRVQDERESAGRAADCPGGDAEYGRFSVRGRPCVRISDSRAVFFAVLSLCLFVKGGRLFPRMEGIPYFCAVICDRKSF